MKIITMIGLILLSPFVLAEATTVSQLYYGSSPPYNSCGPDGRLATTKELKEKIGQKHLCNYMGAKWGIFKIQHTDGHNWSLMGHGYNCEIKQGVDPTAQSVCVMKSVPDINTAYLFPSTDYRGNEPFNGRAVVNHIGDEVPNTDIRSFRLGEGIQLVAYPLENYQGRPFVYTSDFRGSRSSIKSYKIKTRQSEKDITFEFTSNTAYKTCLVLKSASNAIPEANKICSHNGSLVQDVLTKMQDKPSTINVAVYTEMYLPQGLQQTTGAFFIEFDGKGGYNLLHTESLPTGLTVAQSGLSLLFTYNE